MPIEFAFAGPELVVKADGGDGTFGEADIRVTIAYEGGGHQADVGGVAHPAELFSTGVAGPLDKFVELTAGLQGI